VREGATVREPSILSKKQIFWSRVSLGAAAVLLGLFLLLVEAGAIKLPGESPFLKVLPSAVLFAAAAVCLSWAFIQDNTLTLWFAIIFAISACVSFLAGFTGEGRGYGFYYPIYLFAAAAASLVTAVYSGKWRDHLKIIVVFGGLAVLFMLQAMLNVSWWVVLPLVVLFLGGCMIVWAVLRRRE